MHLFRSSSRPKSRLRRCAVHPDRDRKLQALTRWVSARQGRAFIYLDGKLAAVLVAYADYTALERRHTQAVKQELLDQVAALRRRPLPARQ